MIYMQSVICSLIRCTTYFWLHACVLVVMYYILFCWNLLFSYIICRWLSSKEIDQEDINYWRRQIPHLMCETQKYLPLSFFNAQEHYLIHQVEEIEKCGPVHTRSTWMVERHLKSLKDFVRQRGGSYGRGIYGISNYGLYYWI